MYEVGVEHTLKSCDETLVYHLVEELQVVLAVLQCPAYAELYEVLLELHQSAEVEECHLRLHHPELSEVPWRVGVLGAERRAEGVDGSKRGGSELALELSRHGERGLLAEEVVGVVYLAVLGLLEVVEVLGSDLEHLARSLAVAGGDERRVEVEVAVLMEVCVYGHGHVVAYAHDCPEGVGAQTQVRVLPHVLKRLSLLLHGIVGAAQSVHLDVLALYLRCLARSRALHERTRGADACACGDLLEHVGIKLRRVYHYLHVLYSRAIVECDEVYGLAAAVGAYPSLDVDDRTEISAFQDVNNFCPACLFHLYVVCLIKSTTAVGGVYAPTGCRVSLLVCQYV